MKDLGPLQYFLGVEVAHRPSGIFLTQHKYALEIVSEVGMSDANPIAFPLEQYHKLPLAEGPYLDDPEKYRRLVGRLIYLYFTRPELTYSVHVLSQFMQNPKEAY